MSIELPTTTLIHNKLDKESPVFHNKEVTEINNKKV